jgi:hypothetical protein
MDLVWFTDGLHGKISAFMVGLANNKKQAL